jgi:hypothetical protein
MRNYIDPSDNAFWCEASKEEADEMNARWRAIQARAKRRRFCQTVLIGMIYTAIGITFTAFYMMVFQIIFNVMN